MPAETFVAYAAALLVGLCLGSFLNVVIYRMPLQLESLWRRDSRDFLGLEPEQEAAPAPNLVFPPSHCPECHQSLKPWHNIPVISYLFLRGRCAHCAAPISLQYPLVEMAAGLATVFLFASFGLTVAGFMVLVFSLILITLTGIDFNHQLLPDVLTPALAGAACQQPGLVHRTAR